jgi:hypothetical protein
MHSQSPLHVGAFVTWCIRNVAYFDAFWRIVHRCIFMHSWRGAFARIVVHVDSGAFLYSCILMHSHVSHLQMHFVSTARPKPNRVHAACFLVSLALSPLGFFVYVCVVHESGPHASVYPHACWGIFMHSHASWSSHEASIMLSSYHRVWRIQIRQCSSFVNWVYKFMHMNAS